MVKDSSTQLDRTFAALADPTRRAILARLSRGEVSVGELAEPFAMSLPAVSKHLRVLERAGLLQQDRQGRIRRCRLDAAPMKEAADWIEHYRRFWTDQLGSLATFLEGAPDAAGAGPASTDTAARGPGGRIKGKRREEKR